jgi:translation elongation factor EF-Tu-like GTPase
MGELNVKYCPRGYLYLQIRGMNPMPDFIAVLTYLSAEEGGRKTPARSRYRPGIKFPFSSMQTSGQQIFIGTDIVYPGETVEAEIKYFQ